MNHKERDEAISEPEEDTAFSIRHLSQPLQYPYSERLQKNIFLALSIANGMFSIPKTLKGMREWPKTSGVVPYVPNTSRIPDIYATYLQEILIEAALFIRGFDDFWMNRAGVTQWPKRKEEHCGSTEFIKVPKEKINLTLRKACDKIIHQRTYHYGTIGKEEKPVIIVTGVLSEREWKATIEIQEFCFLALIHSGFPVTMVSMPNSSSR